MQDCRPGSLRGVHAAAVAATLGGQWDALDTGKQVDEMPGCCCASPASCLKRRDSARAGLWLVYGTREGCSGGPSRLDRTLQLDRLSSAGKLRADELRLHPLVREFAAGKTDAAGMPAFRRACALNLLGAYQDVTELERQCAQRGVDALEADLQTALSLLPDDEDAQPFSAMLQQLLRMVQLESHILRGWNQVEQPASSSSSGAACLIRQ